MLTNFCKPAIRQYYFKILLKQAIFFNYFPLFFDKLFENKNYIHKL